MSREGWMGGTELGPQTQAYNLPTTQLTRQQWGCQVAAHAPQPGGLQGQRQGVCPALPSESL